MAFSFKSVDFMSAALFGGIFTYVIGRAISHSLNKKVSNHNVEDIKNWLKRSILEAENITARNVVRLYNSIKCEKIVDPFVFMLLIQDKTQEKKPQDVKPKTSSSLFDLRTHIADLNSQHLLVYNKFMVFPGHLLIITRERETQNTPISFEDLYWTWNVMNTLDGIAFYNSNKTAGASVDHKHLQVFPKDLLKTGVIEEIDAKAELVSAFEDEIRENNKIKITFFDKYAVQCIKLRALGANEYADEYVRYLSKVYHAVLRDLRSDRANNSFNLIFTKKWLFVGLRIEDKAFGVSLNSLSLLGSFLFTSEEKMIEFEKYSPEEIYSQILVPKNT